MIPVVVRAFYVFPYRLDFRRQVGVSFGEAATVEGEGPDGDLVPRVAPGRMVIEFLRFQSHARHEAPRLADMVGESREGYIKIWRTNNGQAFWRFLCEKKHGK